MLLLAARFTEDDHSLEVIDQRALPGRESVVVLRTLADTCLAISNMTVRGAPLLGVVAAQGMAFGAREGISPQASKQQLDSTRPTAVNLAKMTARMLPFNTAAAAFAEARAIAEEERQASERMADLGAQLLVSNEKAAVRVIHHCNTGALCTYGVGTALGCVIRKHQLDPGSVFAYVDETRPRQQGLKLTAWELAKHQVPHQVICDSAAGSLLRQHKADYVVFGADRICANGDVVNKIGTYPLSLCAREAGVPVYCVAPTSTIDFAMANGDLVEIEERSVSEIVGEEDQDSIPAYNPAFDVTPHKYVTAIVTELGVCYPPFAYSLAQLRKKTQEAGGEKEEAEVEVALDKLCLAAATPAAVKRTGAFLGDKEEEGGGQSEQQRLRTAFRGKATHIGGEEASPNSSSATSSVRQFAGVKKSSIVLTDEAMAPLSVKSSVRIHHGNGKGHFPGSDTPTPQSASTSTAKGHASASSSSNNNNNVFG